MSAPARLSRALSHAAPAAAEALVLSYSLTCGRARPGQAAGASVNDPTPSATSTTRGAIVVAHGLLGNKTNWQTVVKGLAFVLCLLALARRSADLGVCGPPMWPRVINIS